MANRSRCMRHLVLMIAFTGTAAASDEPTPTRSMTLEPLTIEGEPQAPSVVSLVTRQDVAQPTRVELERSFLGEIVTAVSLLPE